MIYEKTETITTKTNVTSAIFWIISFIFEPSAVIQLLYASTAGVEVLKAHHDVNAARVKSNFYGQPKNHKHVWVVPC